MSNSSDNSRMPLISSKNTPPSGNTPTKKDIEVLRDEMKCMETRITDAMTDSLQKQAEATQKQAEAIQKQAEATQNLADSINQLMKRLSPSH